MKKNLCVLVLFLTFAIIVNSLVYSQQPIRAYNTTLYDTLNPSPAKGQERYSALWGYTASDGREYALLGGYNGTHIIDITEHPVKQVAFIAGTPSGWREIKAVNGYAYIVTEGSQGTGDGLQIIDLTKLPNSATLVKNDTSLYKTAHTISQEGKYIYVHGTQPQAGVNGGTFIYDISNPTNPVVVGKWAGRYVHDATIKNDTMYCAAINDGRLDIVYLGADRKNPTFVTDIRYPGAGTHNSDLTTNSRYIMTTDEVGSTAKTLKIWDRSDVNNMSKVVEWTPSPNEIIHNVHTKGEIAVIAWYTAGTRIVDISNPLQPAEIAYFDTYLGANGGYSGNWEVYPYFSSGKIIASDMQNGLYVFTLNRVMKGAVKGIVMDEQTRKPMPNVTIQIPELGKRITSDNEGRYRLDGAIDTLSYSVTTLNYFTKTGSLILTQQENTTDILVKQMPLRSYKIAAANNGVNLPKFSYRVVSRPESGSEANAEVMLPRDSTYQIYVSAWGYNSEAISTNSENIGLITAELKKGYADDFENDLGWATQAPTDKAVAGKWERGIPIRTRAAVQGRGQIEVQPAEDHSSKYPFLNRAYLTGITGSQAGAGATDIDSGAVTLTSPIMDLTNLTNPFLSCWLWFSRDGNTQTPPDDTLKLFISNDAGKNWILLDTATDSPQKWFLKDFDLRKRLNITSEMMFRIVAADEGKPSLVEAGIDDFAVTDGSINSVYSYFDDSTVMVRVLGNPVIRDVVFELKTQEPQQNAVFEIYSLSGEKLITTEKKISSSGRTVVRIPAQDLPSGTYNYVIRFTDGQVTGKFIKE